MVYLSVPVIVKPALIHSDAHHVIRVDVIHTLWLDDWSAVTQLPGDTKYTFTTLRIVSLLRTVGKPADKDAKIEAMKRKHVEAQAVSY